jgi:hypothetical protein
MKAFHAPAFLALLALVSGAPALAETRTADDEVGVLRLFDEFVSSGAAATQCVQPDDYATVRFLSNFQWVSTHATREIGRQNPDSSADDVAAELARRSQTVKDSTHALVRSEGCQAASVQLLVRRFAIQAAWKREG